MAWNQAYEHFAAADLTDTLERGDLEHAARAAQLAGHDADGFWTRAVRESEASGEVEHHVDSVVAGYLLIPDALQALMSGDASSAYPGFREVLRSRANGYATPLPRRRNARAAPGATQMPAARWPYGSNADATARTPRAALGCGVREIECDVRGHVRAAQVSEDSGCQCSAVGVRLPVPASRSRENGRSRNRVLAPAPLGRFHQRFVLHEGPAPGSAMPDTTVNATIANAEPDVEGERVASSNR